jgi:nitrogen fixation/metabolism regulation signal transduction histidine kinase
MHDDTETNAAALHEIMQPLNVIRLSCGNVRARLSTSSGNDLDYVREKIARIEEQASRAASLLQKWTQQQRDRDTTTGG